jgi:hypothetical protein
MRAYVASSRLPLGRANFSFLEAEDMAKDCNGWAGACQWRGIRSEKAMAAIPKRKKKTT